MKVLVLGAGVVGTTAAYYLARAGHAVTVIDRQPGAALETSFANGGQISASHVEPWASPGTLVKALKWMGDPDAPLIIRWARWDPALWAWLARFLRNCTPGRERLNTERALRLALYSRASLKALRAETGISYDERQRGILHVFRSDKDMAEGRHMAEQARVNGLESHILDRAGMLAVEPALTHVADDLTGAIHFPEDESGDAHLFTTRLADLAKDLGVTFRFGVSIQKLETDRANRRITGVHTDAGLLTADRYVLALGSYSPFIARTVGLRLPIYPAKGYSITLPIAETGPGRAPARPRCPSSTGPTRWSIPVSGTACALPARPSWPAGTKRCGTGVRKPSSAMPGNCSPRPATTITPRAGAACAPKRLTPCLSWGAHHGKT